MQLPEKIKLEFENLSWENISNINIREVTEGIQAISERVLYHWKSYPINLPTSIVDEKDVCVKDLFVLPTFDELDALTTDCKGNPKFLIHNQLQSIKRKGQFTVSSINFPGQTHVWKLNPIFQKGIETAREEYLDGVAFGLRFLVVYGPQLIHGECPSLRHGLNSLRKDLLELIDLVVGYGKVHVPNLERRIHEERQKFLVAELRCKGDGAREIGRYIRNQSSKAMREKVTMAMERPPPIPYRFTTPVSLDVDLRLFDRDVFRKIAPLLGRILEKSSRGWFLSFREKVIAELRSRKLTENEIEMEANVMVMEEYLKRVSIAIRASPEISAVSSDVDRLLMEQAQFYVLMHRAVDNVALKLDSYLQDQKKDLVGDYPVLSRDQIWMEIQTEKAKSAFYLENQWLPHEIALEFCRDRFLKQHSYFLGRDLAFMRDTEYVLRKEIQADKIPCRTFEWKTLIWRPKNYAISRTLYGQTETIPTVVSGVTTTITNPRTDPYHPNYSMRRMTSRFTTTRWPLWRLTNIIFRTVSWMLNAMYFLGHVVPWNSSISFRALFLPRPFFVSLVLNQVNGTLCPKKSSQMSTLCSRLTSIWRHVSKARTKFESDPDTGFLGKGWSRFLNRIWNYFFKGFLPSFFLLLLFPLISLIVCFGSLLFAVTAPLWMPPVLLVFHLVCILIYDFDTPSSNRPRICPLFVILGSILIQGILESVFCVLGAALLCPLVSAFIVLWSLLNYGVRLCWDSLMFYALIKPKGRLPSGNSWLVKRIMGPGLAPEFYFEISVEQALIAFQTRLETEELNIFYQKTNKIITHPQIEYKNFFSACFASFSGKLVETEGPYRDLIRETQVLRSHLEEKFLRRRNELEDGLGVATRSRIRMRKPELEKTLLAARKMAQTFYPDKIFGRMSCAEEVGTYWEARGLEDADWMNLTALLMSEVFCQDFLTPLEDSDVSFSLEMNLQSVPIPTEYFLKSIEDDYWSGEDVVTMSKVKYQIHSPYLDVSAFNPLASNSSQASEDVMSRHISIPLPILHPAHISVIIHNRETEHPFQWDSAISQAILKALQDSGPMLNQDCISLDVDSSISSSDELEEDTQARSTPTHEDILAIETPSPAVIYVPEDSSRSGSGQLTVVGTSPPLSLPIGRMIPGHSSKASLASPEEMSLEDVVHSKFGTSV